MDVMRRATETRSLLDLVIFRSSSGKLIHGLAPETSHNEGLAMQKQLPPKIRSPIALARIILVVLHKTY